jgi:two-component system response regulator HydG
LLLDEIAEMNPPLQAKLLRVLQDGRFQRLGGTRDLRVDFRLLSATHADVPRAIEADRFRQDLYYRINTVQIVLPPLRDRTEDIPLLAAHFLNLYAARLGKPMPAIAPGAIDQLLAHPWPGNVRELEHVIQRAAALLEGDTIRQFAFAPRAAGPSGAASAASVRSEVSIPVGTTLAEATRRLTEATLERCAGNKLQAAKMLGVAPRTMYRRFPASED